MTEKEPNDTTSGTSPDQSSDFLRAIGNFFRDHPAIAGSLLYLQVTTVGVVYSWSLFRQFRINIFDYAETNDFLLAAFKDPTVFTMSVISVLTAICSGLVVVVWQRRRIRNVELLSPLFRTGGISILFPAMAVALTYTLLIPYFFARTNAAELLAAPENEPLTSVQYRATSRSNEQTTETGLRVIGTTQSFVFFYHRVDSRTLIIPTAQIVQMEHDGPPKGESKEDQ